MNNDWPPPYSHRYSMRARRPQVHYSLQRGIEVVIPLSMKKQVHGITILNQHRRWIERQLAKTANQRVSTQCQFPPKSLSFQAVNQYWHVIANAQQTPNIIDDNQGQLSLRYRPGALKAMRQTLIRWGQMQGQKWLCPWMAQLSEQVGLQYKKVTIRSQRTRWGSCSSQGTISLNWQILFLPHGLAEHIMLHELCHLRYLDHSPQFWQLLQAYDPDCHVHNTACRQAAHHLPAWLVMDELQAMVE